MAEGRRADRCTSSNCKEAAGAYGLGARGALRQRLLSNGSSVSSVRLALPTLARERVRPRPRALERAGRTQHAAIVVHRADDLQANR